MTSIILSEGIKQKQINQTYTASSYDEIMIMVIFTCIAHAIIQNNMTIVLKHVVISINVKNDNKGWKLYND